MEEIAQVYARALFEVAQEQESLETIRSQLGEFTEMLAQHRDVAIFFFSPYFSTEEKKQGLAAGVIDADPALQNFLEALIERHRMPAIFRIRTRFDSLVDKADRRLPVQVTSAVPLDEKLVASIGERIGEQTGNKIELSAHVDPEIIGGIILRVGNFIMDASIANRLNQLRQSVAQA
jgi:ATP synthase F1 delta subunit